MSYAVLAGLKRGLDALGLACDAGGRGLLSRIKRFEDEMGCMKCETQAGPDGAVKRAGRKISQPPCNPFSLD